MRLGFLVLLFFPLLAMAAEAPASSDATRQSFGFTDSHRAYVAPTIEWGAHTQSFGASLGFLNRRDFKVHNHNGMTVTGPFFKALGLAHDNKLQAGMLVAAISLGIGGWEWLPMSVEVGAGSAFSSGYESLGVLDAGVFLGTADSLQFGVVSYTPLATSNKPAWYPNWAISVKYPFTIGRTHQSKVVVTRE